MVQKTVNMYPAAAVQGDRGSQNAFPYTPLNYIAGADITTGTYVWLSTSDETMPQQVLNTGTGAPLGFVERILDHFLYDLTEEGSLVIPKGGRVTVAMRGNFYIPANTTVTVGMAVFANLTTGAATFAAAGSTQSGSIETTYRAMIPGAEGDMILISNEAAVAAATANTSDLSAYAKADLSNVTGQLPIANGGTGVTAVGTAGQVLTTNSGANGTEWTTPTGA